jgi:hypothetical protein
MELDYNRDEALKKQFNDFFKQFGIEDLYSQLSNEQLINLKKLLSCINNIITLRTTDAFVEKLFEDKFITQEEKEKILVKVREQHANTNGYDVRYNGEYGNKKIIAEVKCNIPVNKSSFGAAQEEGILDDIHHLLIGKKKEKIDNIASYYKFMVILKWENIDICVDKIIKRTEHVKLYMNPSELDTENVFVVIV